ncbi:MAG: hypothetical protein U0414_40630 [Polyangiaceae bacterium]
MPLITFTVPSVERFTMSSSIRNGRRADASAIASARYPLVSGTSDAARS